MENDDHYDALKAPSIGSLTGWEDVIFELEDVPEIERWAEELG